MRKVNFHTHTDRCGHAIGTAEEYVLSAIDAGFQILGFADHTPWPYHSVYHSRMRMPLQDLEPYIREIRSLQALYREKISVRLGLECECFPRYLPWLQEMVQEWKLDYLILGSHFYPTDEYGPYFGQCVTNIRMLNLYVNATLEGMQSGLFAYLPIPICFYVPIRNLMMPVYRPAKFCAGPPRNFTCLWNTIWRGCGLMRKPTAKDTPVFPFGKLPPKRGVRSFWGWMPMIPIICGIPIIMKRGCTP